jgi:hypothetical protein
MASPPRTDAELVRGILLNDYDSEVNPDLSPFINEATMLVDDLALRAIGLGVAVTDGRLQAIESNLAAHFYGMSDRPYTSRSTAGGSGSFDGKTDKGLDATLYGQKAKILDPTGFLASLGAGAGGGAEGAIRPKVGGFWAGTEYN